MVAQTVDNKAPRTFDKRILYALLIVVAAMLFIAIGWLLGKQQSQPIKTITYNNEPVSLPIVREPSNYDDTYNPVSGFEPPVAPDAPDIVIVDAPEFLSFSDKTVLLAVADLSPDLAQWLIPEEQIRKWVLAIDLMADGKLPRRYRPVDYPMQPYKAAVKGIDTYASHENYPRMTALVNAAARIDPEKLTQYYRQWLPLLEKAYEELGKKGNFNLRFQQFIKRILDNQPLNAAATLERPSVLYHYTDQQLEQSSDLDKLLWRIGENNTENIQGLLRELRFHLESEE